MTSTDTSSRKVIIGLFLSVAYSLLPIGFIQMALDPVGDGVSMMWFVQSLLTGPMLVHKLLGIDYDQ
jgi:hypothetical protein